MHRVSWLLCLLGAGGLAGCTSSEVLVAHAVDLEPVAEEIPEQQLLDVAVGVFDPGVPEGEIDKELLEELLREGTFVQIRRAEARYMAVELRDTLQRSGHWGTVWVTPKPSNAMDLNVTAEILHSDGDQFRLQVRAVDATGRTWLDERYDMETAAGAFNRQRYPELDPYQDVFNDIANDLADARLELSAEDTTEIRQVAQLRYAAELSPEAFGDHVTGGPGDYALNRLPAENDPMFERTLRVRQREHFFLETLNQHYNQFHDDALEDYDGWRQYAREEALAVRELTRSARWRTGLGIATVIASIVYGTNSNNDSFSDRVVRDALMYVGMDVIRSGAVHRQERRLHTEALEELSVSFDEDIQPLVVEIQGTQHRLSGTAEIQYEEWQQLLRQLFIQETGFEPEIDIYSEPEQEGEPLEPMILPPEEEPPAGIEAGVDDADAPAETEGIVSDATEDTGAGA